MSEAKVAVVTGGNRGIGLEVCKQLAAGGMRVVAAARDVERGRAAAAEHGFEFHALDVGDPASIDAFAAFAETLGRVDVLVNDAGVYSKRNVISESMDEFRRVFEINVWGALALQKKLVPGMKARKWGRVVNVSSGLGRSQSIDTAPSAYGLSKYALGAVTRMMAKAVAGSGVLVNACDPGWVRTDMGGAGAPRSIEQGADTIVWLATLPDGGPSGQLFHDRQRVDW